MGHSVSETASGLSHLGMPEKPLRHECQKPRLPDVSLASAMQGLSVQDRVGIARLIETSRHRVLEADPQDDRVIRGSFRATQRLSHNRECTPPA